MHNVHMLACNSIYLPEVLVFSLAVCQASLFVLSICLDYILFFALLFLAHDTILLSFVLCPFVTPHMYSAC